MFYDDEEFTESFWQHRSAEAENMVCELVEWIETIEDDIYMDEEALTLLARAKEVACRP